MSRLLIAESPLVVIPSLAEKIGLNEAIVIQQIHYWLSSDTHKKFIYGKYWIYNSYQEWQKKFCFWSVETIKRTILSLEKKGLLLSNNFNSKKTNRTKWYTIEYSQINKLGIIPSNQVDPMQQVNSTPSTVSICSDATDQNDPLYKQKLLTENTTKTNNTVPMSAGNVPNKNQYGKNTSNLLVENKTGKHNDKNEMVVEIFNFWQKALKHSEAKLDFKRKSYIQKALKLGYSIKDLKLAIEGVIKTPYNMGDNERGEIYDDFHVIFRDAAQIERFIRNGKSEPFLSKKIQVKSFMMQDAEICKNAYNVAKNNLKQLKQQVIKQQNGILI